MEKIVLKISELRRRAEALLDNHDFDLNKKEKEETRKSFEASRDTTLVRGISTGLPDDHIDRIVMLFSKMSLFFEAGVMIENQDGLWTAQATFERGVIETIDTKNTQTKNSMRMPHVEILTVLKTNAGPILEKLKLKQLDPKHQLQCLLIKISSDFSFLLLSTLPDLWLKEHIENIRQALQNGIAD